jgi:competence protein ComEA
MPGRTEPLRPEPKQRVVDRVAEWVRWVGLGRLVASAVSVAVVVVGVFWLLQAPAPAAESTLPVASAPSAGDPASPTVTLPPPGPGAETGGPPPSSPATSSPAGPIVVHVAGAVARPGLVTLEPDSRAGDAVAAAGGPSDEADLDALNLAAPLSDGQRVYVPSLGEVDPAAVPSGPAASVTAGSTVAAGPVDINTATASDLEQLPGVGPATALAIVDDRDRNGPFASVDDLDRVRGIGPAKLDALRELVRV